MLRKRDNKSTTEKIQQDCKEKTKDKSSKKEERIYHKNTEFKRGKQEKMVARRKFHLQRRDIKYMQEIQRRTIRKSVLPTTYII